MSDVFTADALTSGLITGRNAFENRILTRQQARDTKEDRERRHAREDAQADRQDSQEGRRAKSFELDQQLKKLNLDEQTHGALRKRLLEKSPEQIALENTILTQQTQKLSNDLAKRTSFEAFDLYNEDADTAVLTRMIQDNPILARAYGEEIASVERVNPETDVKQIREAGMDPLFFSNGDSTIKANITKRFVKIINKDGTSQLADMQKIYAATGYTNHLSNSKREQLLKDAQFQKATTSPKVLELKQMAELLGITPKEVLEIENNKKTEKDEVSSYSAIRNDADALRELGFTEAEIKDRFARGKNTRTSKEKDIVAAETSRQKAFSAFGGEQKFYDTDFSKRDNFRKVSKDLLDFEKLEGISFDKAEKKTFEKLAKLTQLGEGASGLSSQQTGIVDSVLHNAKTYVFDNVDKTKAVSAYGAFQAIMKNALYGSAQSGQELKDFKKSFGTLGKQQGAVLEQFRLSVEQVRTDLESLSRFKSPLSVHVRLGQTEKQLDAVMTRLDEAIEFVSGNVDNIDDFGSLDDVPDAPTNRPSLADLAKKAGGR